jgi:hypothetical protein
MYITAMTDNFQKKDAIESLAKLERIGLIDKKHHMLKNSIYTDS